MTEEISNRMAVLSQLVKQSPGRELGRTAMMKFAYFLTTLRKVPLGYRFSLYSYGPFDSAVLQDVDFASNLGALRSLQKIYPNGTGYSIQADSASDSVEAMAHDFLATYSDDIGWVVNEFGRMTASELELCSTVVYIDREACHGAHVSQEELAKRVRDVKPHFTTERILLCIQTLGAKQLLEACV